MRKIVFFTALMSLYLLPTPSWARKEVIRLVTFEAPPFMDPKLPEQGAGVFALKRVFLKAGYDLKITFAPLKRAKVLSFAGDEDMGYFPVSPYDLDPKHLSSKVVYESPWVIAQRKEKPIVWKKPIDLGKYVGGANLQYTNPTAIKNLIQAKKLTVQLAPDDRSNLIKLGNKRIDYIFIDAGMFSYLTHFDPQMKAFANNLEINPHPVEIIKYTVAFRKSTKGQRLLDDFNRVLSPAEFAMFIAEYLKKYEQKQ